MSSTQVIFKPGGVVALVAVSAMVVTGIVVALGGSGSQKNVAGAAPAPPPPVVTDAANMSDEQRLVSLNNDTEQARDWLFLGPLPTGTAIPDGAMTDENRAQMLRIIGTPYLPTEAKYQAHEDTAVTLKKESFRWRKVHGSAFNFQELFDGKNAPSGILSNVVVYGYTTIESKGAARKNLHFRSDDGAIVWMNGQQVYRGNEIRGVDIEDVIPVELRDGQNNVLVKVGQGSNGWGMSFHLEDRPEK